jgi:hypothetical protein
MSGNGNNNMRAFIKSSFDPKNTSQFGATMTTIAQIACFFLTLTMLGVGIQHERRTGGTKGTGYNYYVAGLVFSIFGLLSSLTSVYFRYQVAGDSRQQSN